MPKHQSIFITYLKIFIVLQAAVIFTLGLGWLFREHAIFAKNVDILSAQITNSKKELIQSHVNAVKNYIYTQKAALEAEIRNEIYKTASLLEADIKSGKTLAHSLETINRIFKDRYKFEISDNDSSKLSPEVETAVETYGLKGIKKEKYVFTIEPNHLYILAKPILDGKTIYIFTNGAKKENDLKNSIIDFLDTYRFVNGHYIFAADWSGTSLTIPAKGKNVINVQDVNGVKIVQEFIKISKKGSGFLKYTMPDFKGVKQQPKISYATGIKEWKWYIGSGIYLPDLDSIVSAKKEELNRELLSNVLKSLLTLIVISIIAAYVLVRVYTTLQHDFQKFSEAFVAISHNNAKLDRDSLKLKEFRELSDALNEMIEFREKSRKEINFLSTAVNSATDIAFISTDTTGQINFASQGAASIFRSAISDDEEKNIKELVVEEDLDRFRNIMKQMDSASETISAELRLKKSGNKEFFADIAAYTIYSKSDKSVYYVFIIKDITENKLLHNALEQSMQLFKSLSENSPSAIVLLNNEGVIYANSNMYKLTGYTKEELEKTKPWEINVFAENSSCKDSIIKRLQGDNADLNHEVKFTNQKGEEKWIGFLSESIIYEGKNAELVNLIDITFRKEYERDLSEKSQELILLNKNLETKVNEEMAKRREKEVALIQQSKLASMGEMIGAIAHQWRQPLNALGLLVQDIQEAHSFDELDDKYIDDTVKKAMKHISYMSNTIDDFRDFNKLDKEKTVFNVKNAIISASDLLMPQFSTKGIKISIIIEEESHADICVYGMINEFKQVVLNLINNAKEAFENVYSYKEKFLNIEIAKFDDRVRVIVTDNAEGIPEDIRGRIFEPYFTTKLDVGGTGIGLYMCKIIIDSHMDGSLEYEPAEDGSKFIIELKIHSELSPSDV